MNADFRISAVPRERFAHFLSMSDGELSARGARRMQVDAHPGYPCRVSLVDAMPGESVILLPYRHHDVDSPYQSLGPVFVREAAQTATPAVNEVPVMLRHRLLSLRAYDGNAAMKNALVIEGTHIEDGIRELFDDPRVEYLHVHNAKPGCYNCEVRRR